MENNSKINSVYFLLASKSERRKMILERDGFIFDILASEKEFNIIGRIYDGNLLKQCAKSKIEDVYDKIVKTNLYKNLDKDLVIISADTIVVLNNKIIGKPKDKNDAINILTKLSNSVHFVETGIYLMKVDCGDLSIRKSSYESEKTYIEFRKLSTEEIEEYVELRNPFDKAGAYGIQDEKFDFVKNITGDMDNVVGFPIKLFNKMMKDYI